MKKTTLFWVVILISLSRAFCAAETSAAEQKVWEKTADFGGAKPVSRLALDIPVDLDLRCESGISFEMRSESLDKFSRINIYFKSGDGWYMGGVVPGDSDGWQRIVVRKRDITYVEGKTIGWGSISRLRFAGWRGATVGGKAHIAVRGISRLSTDSQVLVISGEPYGDDSVRQCAATFSCTMDAAGIIHSTVTAGELVADDFKNKKVAVLPYNGSMPEDKRALIKQFVANGGRLIACYTAQPDILSAIGVKRIGWFSNKSSGEPPFTGFLRQNKGLKNQPEFVGQISPYAAIAVPEGEGEVVANWALAGKVDSGKPAIVRTGKGIFISHVLSKGASQEKVALMQSLFSALMPEMERKIDSYRAELASRRVAAEAELEKLGGLRPGERFAAWCHTAYGPAATWDETLGVLSQAGCTDLIANLCWGGHAFYKSSLLPIHPSVAKRGDAFELLREACRKNGVKLHVWRVCGNLEGSSQEYRRRLDKENRLCVNFDGKKMESWVCLSHPANIELEIASIEELAVKGAPGVHMDYIRYRDADTCFCGGCKERFERFAGVKVSDWPKSVKNDEALFAKWNEFRCKNIDAIVEGVYRRVRAKNPKCEISAAVFPNWNTSPTQVAQNSAKWCEKGLLDFICPMNYSDSTAFFINDIRLQKTLVGKVPLLSGIGLSCWRDDGDDAGRFARQIRVVREAGLPGWTLFDLNDRGYATVKKMAEINARRKK